MKSLLVAWALLSTLWASPAHAYVDPGTGALLWQLILAAIFGFLFYIRRFVVSIWARVRRAWTNREKPDG